jgi:hypothetical protein
VSSSYREEGEIIKLVDFERDDETPSPPTDSIGRCVIDRVQPTLGNLLAPKENALHVQSNASMTKTATPFISFFVKEFV